MKATVQFTIQDAGSGKTSVLFSFNRSGDDGSIPDEKVTLTPRKAGSTVTWRGSFELEPAAAENVSYSFSFQAPVGASYSYAIKLNKNVLAEQQVTRMVKEFDAIVGDLS